MTGRERLIAELAAQDLESWARQLPLGSGIRRELQQTARAYRFAARAGGRAGALRAVPDTGAEQASASVRHASRPGERAPDGPPSRRGASGAPSTA